MKFETIELTGTYPSDFEPTVSALEVQQFFEAHGFHVARMIGGSKSHYCKEHEGSLIVFNANIIMPGYGKVWYGDLNLTEDCEVLKSIANSINVPLYVLSEMDARFGEEMKSITDLIEKALWNTTEDKPNLEWLRKKRKDKSDGRTTR
jgi:hypothetical protein